MRMIFKLTGDNGYAKYEILTGWLLPDDKLREENRKLFEMGTFIITVPTAPNKENFYGSSTYGAEIFDEFLRKGGDVIWRYLEQAYAQELV